MRARTRHTRSTVLDSDDSHSESDGSEARENGLFDDEAAESAESTDENSDSEEEEIEPFAFHRLPPELRLRVWTLFCPDLLGSPRVLDFNVHDSLSPTRKAPCKVIGAGRCLEYQTRELRCVFGVNRESRAIAKERFPDELHLESDDGEEFTLCVNLATDVAMLDRVPDFSLDEQLFSLPSIKVNLAGFSQEIVNLALPLHDPQLHHRDTDVTAWLRKFTSLGRLFLYTDEDSFDGRRLKDESLRWCASPHARQYYMETFEKEPGYGEDYTILACWPDAKNHPTFTKTYVPSWHTKFLFQSQEDAFEDANIKLHPMILFQTAAGLNRFDQFVETDYLPLKVYDGEEEDSEAESYEEDPDEDFEVNGAADDYESDGIDDEEPEIFHESGDEHLDDGGSEEDDGGPSNPFSSPEVSADEGPSARGRKRRIIEDSDDEEDEPSSRPAKRTRVQVIADSDDEAETNGSASNGPANAQVISSDSDSDDDPAPRHRKRPPVASESESDSDDEEEGEEPQRVRLADRLQIRSRNPHVISDDSEDEEDDEEDDEDEDEDDEEDDEDESGFIDNMAAESDEDDEEDEEDE